MIFSSKLIEDAVNEFSKLPGIGKKTALRMILHLLKMEKESVLALTTALSTMRNEVVFCQQCHNIADTTICNICSNPTRDKSKICVVESIRDIIAIEGTGQYNGLYHLLGGVLSPLDGIGPEQLNIATLYERANNGDTKELIMGLSPTIEGDTTIYYIAKHITELPVTITTIARGISFGGELEYADEMTLARSIAKRQPIENYVITSSDK